MKKIQNLKNKSNTQNIVFKASPKVHYFEGFVINRSTQQFSEEQLPLLNKGLAYAVTTKPDVQQAIIDVETAITHTIPTTNNKVDFLEQSFCDSFWHPKQQCKIWERLVASPYSHCD